MLMIIIGKKFKNCLKLSDATSVGEIGLDFQQECNHDAQSVQKDLFEVYMPERLSLF